MIGGDILADDDRDTRSPAWRSVPAYLPASAHLQIHPAVSIVTFYHLAPSFGSITHDHPVSYKAETATLAIAARILLKNFTRYAEAFARLKFATFLRDSDMQIPARRLLILKHRIAPFLEP